MESARTMLQAKSLPVKLWAEAVNMAVYLLNRTAIKKEKTMTPFEAWNKQKPGLSHVEVFGAEAYAYIDKQFRKKMDRKAKKLILVGYQAESRNYRLWSPETDKIVVSRDVFFNEGAKNGWTDKSRTVNLQAWPQQSDDEGRAPDDSREENFESASDDSILEISDSGESEEATIADTPSRSRGLRNRAMIKPPRRYELNFAQHSIPETFQEAVSGPDKSMWIKAIKDELDAHKKNKT